MNKTATGDWQHKGWDITYRGNGYVMTRREPVNGKTVTKRVKSLKHAEIVIENAELKIKLDRTPHYDD